MSQQTHRVSVVARDQRGRDDRAPEELVLLPEILNQAGYSTLAVTGGGFLGRQFGLDQGFERFAVKAKGIESQVRRLVSWIDAASRKDRPVFAFLHTYEVHSPYSPPDSHLGLFGDVISEFEPTSENLKPLQGDAWSALSLEDMQAIELAYDHGIRYVDDVLRRMFLSLEELGFLDNTLVVVTSDHGEEFGEHGGVLHPAQLFDELLHVPLIVSGPGVPTALTDPRLVSTIDVAPTILTAVGVDLPSSMQGRDLFEGGDSWNPEAAVFSQYGEILYSVRTHRWKLIQRTNGQSRLFDLRIDPKEQRNAARAHPEIVAMLEGRLAAWIESQPVVGEETRSPVELTAEEKEQLRSLGYL